MNSSARRGTRGLRAPQVASRAGALCADWIDLPADSVANGVQHVDEVARLADLAQQGDPRQHVHLFVGDIVNATQLLVALELLPRGRRVVLGRGIDQRM